MYTGSQFTLFHRGVDVMFDSGRFVNRSARQKRRQFSGGRCGVMASDVIGPKGPGADLGLGPQPLGDITDEMAATVIEVSGVIKWFDVSKGYGFIVPDNGMADVL